MLIRGKEESVRQGWDIKKRIQTVFAMYLDEEVVRFCERKVGNGVPLPPSLPEDRKNIIAKWRGRALNLYGGCWSVVSAVLD